ncbi:MAG: dephospho-CoA kinase [Chloroflexota bacterium]
MKVIGLTGGIGTGKSTVARFLAELGAVAIDADKIGHEVLKPGSPAWQQVVAEFGKQIVFPDRTIDRRRLGSIVFGDKAARDKLNRIIHPVIRDVVLSRLEEHRLKGTEVLVLEAPLLIEGGWVPLVDKVWVTIAPKAIVLKRLRERTGLSQQEALARIHSQLPSDERAKFADVIIETDCDLDQLKTKIKLLFDRYM